MALNINGTTGISGVDGSASAPAVTGTDSNTGINFGTDTVNINTGGSTRATVDSSGKLAVGTATPYTYGIATFNDSNGIVLEGSSQGRLLFRHTGGGTNLKMFDLASSDGVLKFRTLADNGTSVTERMRINSNGFLKAKANANGFINANSANHELLSNTDNQIILDMKNESSSGYGILMQFNHGSSSNYAFQVYNYASGSNNLYIRTDGDLENVNNSYGGTSDVKLKENIIDAKSQWNDIKALKVRNFNYKADENKTKLLGLVAQEAETVCPSLVKTLPDVDIDNKDLGTETKHLKYSILYMKAVKALQEAQTRIETLETKVAALEAG